MKTNEVHRQTGTNLVTIRESGEIMTTYIMSMDDFSLLSSIASLVLAIVAIWLSIVFYRLAVNASLATTEAANRVAASVGKLEDLFGRFYNDNFSLIRETFTDMRKHTLSTQDFALEKSKSDEIINSKVEVVRKTYESKMSALLIDSQLPREKAEQVERELRKAMEQAIAGTRLAAEEAQLTSAVEFLLRCIRLLTASKEVVTVADVVGSLSAGMQKSHIIDSLDELRKRKVIVLSPDAVAPNSRIRIGSAG